MSKAREISELGDVVTVDGSNVGIGTSSPEDKLSLDQPYVASGEMAISFNQSNFANRATKIIHKIDASGNGGSLLFATNPNGGDATERMRIDSSGNVGIGTSSPASLGTGITTLDLKGNSSSQTDRSGGIAFTRYDGTLGMSIYNADGASYIESKSTYPLLITTNGSEAMRIDASGNLLVGTTSASPHDSSTEEGIALRTDVGGFLAVSRSGSYTAAFNRMTSNGDIVAFRKDGTTVGSIGSRNAGTLTTSYIQFYVGSSNYVGLTGTSSTAMLPALNGSPSDNLIDLGVSGVRFDDIYATNGTIQTSDANEKQQIAELTAAEMQAAKAISKLFKTFKWNDSVAEKGDDARIHTGVIAQEVEAAMTAAGLDAGRYAFFISSTWWESTEVIPAVEEVLDEEGNVVTEAQPERTVTHTYDTAEEAPAGAVERTRKGIRYPELLAFIGAATEQRLASIEARLDALETV